MFGTIAIVILTLAVSIFAGREAFNWLFKKDTEMENRRRAAFHLAATLKASGLKRIPEFLGDYAVGDYSGMYEKIHDLAKLSLAGGDAAVMQEFEKVFDNVFAAKMMTEAGRAALLAKMGVAIVPPAPAPEPVAPVK